LKKNVYFYEVSVNIPVFFSFGMTKAFLGASDETSRHKL